MESEKLEKKKNASVAFRVNLNKTCKRSTQSKKSFINVQSCSRPFLKFLSGLDIKFYDYAEIFNLKSKRMPKIKSIKSDFLCFKVDNKRNKH